MDYCSLIHSVIGLQKEQIKEKEELLFTDMDLPGVFLDTHTDLQKTC